MAIRCTLNFHPCGALNRRSAFGNETVRRWNVDGSIRVRGNLDRQRKSFSVQSPVAYNAAPNRVVGSTRTREITNDLRTNDEPAESRRGRVGPNSSQRLIHPGTDIAEHNVVQ